MAIGSIGLAFLAGVLSILSPCVLPLLPIVLGTAASRHRAGPVALAGGVALSFVTIGLLVATVGFVGFDAAAFRHVAAILMIASGIVLMLPTLQVRLAVAGGPVSAWADRRFGGPAKPGVLGQFGVGLLLGAVWTPCVGPTLGAASVLAARGESLGMVALTMLTFGLGAALPMIGLGMVSRQMLMGVRDRLFVLGKGLKQVLGLMLAAIGLLIVTGLDKQLETWLVEMSPAWLTSLTTQF